MTLNNADDASGCHDDISNNTPGRCIEDCSSDIVITGFSGRLPESSNIEEFKRNLLNGVDMVNDDPRRWEKGIHGIPERMGKIKDEDLQNFDNQFFSVHEKQVESMDPQIRMILECTYEAIVDAGINPSEIRGSRTGVYVGVSASESEQHWMAEGVRANSYCLTGCARSMFANRVSYSFDFKGPSYSVDSACSSSLHAFEHAFNDMRSGKCDSAIVAGSGIILTPNASVQFQRMNFLSHDGKCKVFDESVDGYVRSEGCVVVFLQKKANAKRVYASILNARTNTDGYKEQGITYPNGAMQTRLLRETYEEINVHPNEVVYVEAHGTGTTVGDLEEVTAITNFFCKDRKTPLLVGSVKSNMGHAEPASGVCAIAKVLLAMEEGVIPGNMHYKNPNPDLSGLIDGRLKVVDKNTPWDGGIMGINSFGFGGANAHVVLKSNPKPKVITPTVGPPKMVLCSGRTFKAVQDLLDDAVKHQNDDEYLALINDAHSRNTHLHYYRGYCVMNANGSVQREVFETKDTKRPIFYVYSSMGSQWAGMAKHLMQFEVFAKTIHRCAEALRPEGIDLLEVLTCLAEESFDNLLNSFISITSLQVALTDLLSSLGIKPDGIIGHSLGEMACAYADGCLTPEQTVLASYWRGKCVLSTQLLAGRMASVDLDWEQLHKRLPPDCFPVCHNSGDNCTISGPVTSIDTFVAELLAEGVFAKEVHAYGYAFHSKYIAELAPKLREKLENLIPNPKNRTPRWISTSIPEAAWNSQLAQQASAAYYVNNLLSPVLFYEGMQHVPKNAVVIEIAPTGLMQAVLKRTLGANAISISLVKRGHENNAEFLLMKIGNMYTAGAQPQIKNLFEPVSYPVGRGTPMLSSKIGWDHSQKWFIPKYDKSKLFGETIVTVDLSRDEDAFLAGHVIDGRILFPATGYLTLAWKTFAKLKGTDYEKCPVVMENVTFHRATLLSLDGVTKFGINFFNGTGNFEICEDGFLAVSGKIYLPENIDREGLSLDPLSPNTDGKELDRNDIYKRLRLQGNDYYDAFQGIIKSDATGKTGQLQWLGNWVTFMDTMLQFRALSENIKGLYLPTRIRKVVLNPCKHLEAVAALRPEEQRESGMPVFTYNHINVVKSGGIEIHELKGASTRKRQGTQTAPILERYTFVPYINTEELHEIGEFSKMHAFNVALQIIMENAQCALKIKGVELTIDHNPQTLMAAKIWKIIQEEPSLTADIGVVTSNNNEDLILSYLGVASGVRIIAKNIVEEPVDQNCHFLYASDVLSRCDTMVLEHSLQTIREDGFLLFDESLNAYLKEGRSLLSKFGLIPIAEQTMSGSRLLVLARRYLDVMQRDSHVVRVTGNNYTWLNELKEALAKAQETERYVYIVCQGEELFGAVGFMNCIRKENRGGKLARLVFIQDENAEVFSLSSDFYSQQLSKDLSTNVLKGGVWGSFRHLKLETNVITSQVEDAYVNALVTGDLASLKWIEGPQLQNSNLDDNLELCSVYYSGINFRDIMLSSGKLSSDTYASELQDQDCLLGVEFAGRDSKGRRVMAWASSKSLATKCMALKNMMWEIPENWSIEEACTVPIVYSTAYYALLVRGEAKKGETILIHCGSGGVGQAAITLALHYGLTVFTTVGNAEKREFLHKRFPQLDDSHIGNSRDCSFEEMIMHQTKGKGVDLVLNSLAGEKLQASVRCLGFGGRFLEIGKFDLSTHSALDMSIFLKNITFCGIFLDVITEDEAKQVTKLVGEGIKSGVVIPLPRTVFNDQQIEEAFRFMASGKHIGKVVIKIRDEEEDMGVLKPSTCSVDAIRRSYMHPEKSYIIVGGLGGFGLELANWLVSRRARFLVLTSRSGVKTGYQSLMIKRWRDKGVSVLIDTNDVTTPNGCQKLLENANNVAPVGGIFNLAVVLRDALLEDQTENDFQTVCGPKVEATKWLDKFSRTMCPELHYFVCFSSFSCGRGNVGQTNYGLANSTMERICEMRQNCGFPGLAIQWGFVGDTGVLIDNFGKRDKGMGGLLPQRMYCCLQTMDLFLQQPYPVLSTMVLDDEHSTVQAGSVSLITCVLKILGVRDIKKVHDSTTLVEVGMDSLMCTEIKQSLERNYDIIMSAQEIRRLTLGELKKLSHGMEDNEAAKRITSEHGTARALNVFGDGPTGTYSRELMPALPILRLPSAAPEDCSQRPLFLVSPIDGFVDSLRALALRLDCPVYGLQSTSEANLDSIDSLASFYLKHILAVQPNGPYTIAGYSFGALVAFVIALQLEKSNEEVSLVMLDGAPKYVNSYVTSFKQRLATSDHQKEAHGLAYFSMIVANADFNVVANLLLSIPTWENKLDKCTEIIAKEINQPVHLIKESALCFRKKIEAADRYVADSKVSCDVVLVKPMDNYAKLVDDYGLNEVCQKTVKVVTVEGNHQTFLLKEKSLMEIEKILNNIKK